MFFYSPLGDGGSRLFLHIRAYRFAGANKIPVTKCIIHSCYCWPKLIFPYIRQRENSLFATI